MVGGGGPACTAAEDKLCEATLALVKQCLAYDFVGTSSVDESLDDVGNLQVRSGVPTPHARSSAPDRDSDARNGTAGARPSWRGRQVPALWRPIFESTTTVPLFFDCYAHFRTEALTSQVRCGSTPPHTGSPNVAGTMPSRPRCRTLQARGTECGRPQAMECLVHLASVRQSLFSNDDERARYLGALISGSHNILLTGEGLGAVANVHEFCRFLARSVSHLLRVRFLEHAPSV